MLFEKYKHECVYNHLPKWMKELESELDACITCSLNANNFQKKQIVLLDRYNYLTEKENDPNEDAFSNFGIEDEKEEIIAAIIKMHEPYRKEAERLKKDCD